MHSSADASSAYLVINKPSTSFSTTSTSSGQSRLLFGEIDPSSKRSSRGCNSFCSLVLSFNPAFSRFWLAERCRDSFLSHVEKEDLPSIRLVCHDFRERASSRLFDELDITFKASTFTKPARIAALDRIGHHVNTLNFSLPHTTETFLPPLIDPVTGEERSFTYVPQVKPPATIIDKIRQPKYGDWETTDVLIKQYPPLFHAATNV
ncbi:hypothetical protein LTR66_015412, partial [Elasticomyces elasticus]